MCFADGRTHKGYKDHSSIGDEIKKCFDFTVFLKLPTDVVTISFILQRHKITYQFRIFKNQQDLGARNLLATKTRLKTRLNVTYEKCTARSLALNPFFNN